MLRFSRKAFVMSDNFCKFLLHINNLLSKHNMAKLAIKSDNRKQNLLLPPSLDEPCAGESHGEGGRFSDRQPGHKRYSLDLPWRRQQCLQSPDDVEGACVRIPEQCLLIPANRGTSPTGCLFHVACRNEAPRLSDNQLLPRQTFERGF